jgi:quercetin dioxygenase-like cupin family protein
MIARMDTTDMSNSTEALWFFGSLALVKAEGADYVLVEQLFPKGVETPLHVQPEDDETFYVLEGEVTFFAGEERLRASAGTTVHVPKGTPHGFRVESEPMRLLDVTTPQHVAFFRAVGEPAPELTVPPPGPPDMEKVMAAARDPRPAPDLANRAGAGRSCRSVLVVRRRARRPRSRARRPTSSCSWSRPG